MKNIRIIPCLDIKDGRVVKGVNFVNLKDARDPVEAAQAYCREGADELVFLDIFATMENRKTRMEWVKKVRSVVDVPFAVGGGIASIEDMEALKAIGVDKVSINTAAVKNPSLIEEAALRFGSSSLVVAIDGRKNLPGSNLPRLEVVVKSGEDAVGMDIVEWARKVESMGAGEILLTSMDADGTKKGYDLEITKAVVESVNIPVIASGGCGTLSHFADAFEIAGVDAALAASLFHFGELTIGEVKKFLIDRGIEIRK